MKRLSLPIARPVVLPLVTSLVLCLVGLGALVSGTSYAAGQLAKGSVGTKQLKPNAVTGAKVEDGSLTKADFAPGQLPAGATGPTGPAGPAGAPALTKVAELPVTAVQSTPIDNGELWSRAGDDLGSFTLTTAGAPVRIDFVTSVYSTVFSCAYELRIDGRDSLGFAGTAPGAANARDVTQAGTGQQAATLTTLVTGLSAGSHTVSAWASPTTADKSCTVNAGGWRNAVYVSEYAASTPVVVTTP
ncbi:hypothetical protein [Nocardioides flavescens]|uniref:Uncharacterized protein n=1 Tax=Nocardioides flavescens TaxID=2691959 RepID=A0A6L7ES34_9ACTN|nr:hypothetical protein [Nocardioides flavescens]MXG89490.1 hypothetical protein [Nocardioides flavescens]